MADFDLEAYEKVSPVATVEGIQFCVPNQQCLWRVNTLFTKEPDTLEWISTFDANDVLIDIGANVGMFSMWAALKQGVRVIAFEPESQNYGLLCKNIFINGMDKQVSAYCLAISDDSDKHDGGQKDGVFFDSLYLSEFQVGGSLHSFGDEVDFRLKPRTAAFRQGCACVSLDHFVDQHGLLEQSSRLHIKVDVDGIEHKVMASGENTLQSQNVQSVLIELDTTAADHMRIAEHMQDLGYVLSIHDDAIVSAGPFEGIGNHIFTRPE